MCSSTITQQLAKNLFLSRDRTIKRKIQEMLLAIQLENELTKDEILSAYLSIVPLGLNTILLFVNFLMKYGIMLGKSHML